VEAVASNPSLSYRFVGKFGIYLKAFIASKEAKATEDERERIANLIRNRRLVYAPFITAEQFNEMLRDLLFSFEHQPEEPKT